MNRLLRGLIRFLALPVLLLGAAAPAGAAPLNPDDFASLGAFPTASGTYSFDTGTLTITGPAITTPLQGTLSASGVAVFDFVSINLSANQVFVYQHFGFATTPPVAFLSRGDITINGTLDVRPPQPPPDSGSPGGPGGYGSDFGPGAGSQGNKGVAAGGGGFGGDGGNGFIETGFVGGALGKGGIHYANLAATLQGGSGGGNYIDPLEGLGGAGGGAIELGANGAITIGGSIRADGSSGGRDIFGSGIGRNSGGGAGGGIFLHGNSVTLLSTALLSATGGGGGSIGLDGDSGGGGGGGEVLIEYGTGGLTGSVNSIIVSGGPGASSPSPQDGDPGLISILNVPEPASLVLFGLGLLGVLGFAHQAARRADT
jgi:hypothetical protein